MNRVTGTLLVLVALCGAFAGVWWWNRVLPPNILVIIADDIGVERLAPWKEPHETWPDTPAIDGLAQRGLVFGRAYANPLCTSTRAAALTGRYARRSGAGTAILERSRYQVPTDQPTLPKVLDGAGYTTIALGKWHLANPIAPSGNRHPLEFGFDHHRGFMQKNTYFRWKRVDDGEESISEQYVTEATTDDLIEAANTTSAPWFIWAAYQNAHAPIHAPPAHLNPSGVTKKSRQIHRWHAMIEAMDLELGRAMKSIEPDVLANTVVIFLGDNGSIARFMPDGWEPSGGKGFLAESGIRVPMVVAGPGVRAGRSDILVQVTDLLPTLADIAGVEIVGGTTVGEWEEAEQTGRFDGTSFFPVLSDAQATSDRRYVFAESFQPLGPGPYTTDNGSIRDERYKLTSFRGEVTFHDLQGRHDDGPALGRLTPEQMTARSRLMRVLSRHRKLR